MDPRTISCLLIVFIGGTIFGFSIGYVAPLETFYTYITNCTSVADEKLCNWVGPNTIGGCRWQPSSASPSPHDENTTTTGAAPAPPKPLFSLVDNDVPSAMTADSSSYVVGSSDSNTTTYICAFSGGFNNCSLNSDHDTCVHYDYCLWDETHKKCHHISGWSASQQGIIATMMIIGAFVSSMPAGRIINHLGLKKSLAVASVVNVLAAGLQFGAWAHPDFDIRFSLLLAGRFFTGLSVGLSTVVCPMYVGEVSLPELASSIGVSFQIFVTLGIAFAALLGFVLRPPEDGATKTDHNRFQVLNAINIALTAGQLVISWFVISPETVKEHANPDASNFEEDPLVLRKKTSSTVEGDGGVQQQGASTAAAADADTPFFLRPRYVLTAIVLGGVLQLSGINAVMNFSPEMASSVGLSNPFLANFVVMVWNFVTTLLSVPLSKKVPLRLSFIGGAFIAGIACFVCGIPTYPGVLGNEDTRNGLIIFGILFFIMIFEVMIGPSFYVLAQSIFPPEIRGTGCGASLAANFVFNALINYGYPVAAQAFGGGPSGNRRQGVAICFMLFGGLSVFLGFVLYLLLPKQDASGSSNTLGERSGSMIDQQEGGGAVIGGGGDRSNNSRLNSSKVDDTFLYGTAQEQPNDTSSPRM